MTKNILALDLGAESGRGIVGRFDGEQISLEIVHRFPNGPVRVGDRLYWDVLRLYGEIKEALRQCGRQGGVASVGVDTWGVDFALLGDSDELLGNPRHYRDPHTDGVMEEVFCQLPAAGVFARTGIQFMRFNTLFQLYALKRDRSPILAAARHLLMMPDLFHFWLCGVKANEFTNASTTQCLEAGTGQWARGLCGQLGLEAGILGNIVPPGTPLGELLPSVRQESGLGAVQVIAPTTHDTGAAVAAVPAEGDRWCYLSSGTWSLLGVELAQPCINEQVRAANFTNEGGVNGTIRFLKNIMGLWLVQECRRAWEGQGQQHTYQELTVLAQEAKPFTTLLDPDAPALLLPDSMPAAIAQFAEQTRQPVPQTPGAFVRCCLESLALRYRWVIEKLEALTGRKIETIHIVGGGSQNRVLNQMTASACDRLVLAGPVEATAIGNIITQAMGLGWIGSLAEARRMIRKSFPLERFEPKQPGEWSAAYDRFLQLLGHRS